MKMYRFYDCASEMNWEIWPISIAVAEKDGHVALLDMVSPDKTNWVIKNPIDQVVKELEACRSDTVPDEQEVEPPIKPMGNRGI